MKSSVITIGLVAFVGASAVQAADVSPEVLKRNLMTKGAFDVNVVPKHDNAAEVFPSPRHYVMFSTSGLPSVSPTTLDDFLQKDATSVDRTKRLAAGRVISLAYIEQNASSLQELGYNPALEQLVENVQFATAEGCAATYDYDRVIGTDRVDGGSLRISISEDG